MELDYIFVGERTSLKGMVDDMGHHQHEPTTIGAWIINALIIHGETIMHGQTARSRRNEHQMYSHVMFPGKRQPVGFHLAGGVDCRCATATYAESRMGRRESTGLELGTT